MKFIYLIFIGQKISYFRRYIHARKSPDKMKRFEVTKISCHFQAKTVQLFFFHLRKKLIHLGMQTSTLESRSSCRKCGLHLLLP